jgi:ketosteroid isomerase-like protein
MHPIEAGDRESIVRELELQAKGWDQAIVEKDRDRVTANMSEDFRQIDRMGGVHDRAAFVRDILDPALAIDPYTVEEFEVRLYGDVALLSGRIRMTGNYNGKPFSSHFRYIDVYTRIAQQWKVVSVQITSLPP